MPLEKDGDTNPKEEEDKGGYRPHGEDFWLEVRDQISIISRATYVASKGILPGIALNTAGINPVEARRALHRHTITTNKRSLYKWPEP